MHEILDTRLACHYTGQEGEYYRARHLGVANERVYLAIARQRARKLAPYIDATARVFEYGVGRGFNLAALRCQERVGYDLYDATAELSRWGVRFCSNTATLSAGCFDVALCMHTLEHVFDPFAVLRELRRVLRRDGKLVVCVPLEIEREYRQFDPDNIHQHLYSWNPQTLGMLLTKAGFDLVEIGSRYFGYDRFAARLVCGTRHDALYRMAHWALLRIRPRYEVMAICRRP